MSINNDSVNSLIHELEEKIKILQSPSLKSNLDITTYENVTSIISKYTKRSPKDITIENIVDFKISELSELLQLIGVQPSQINHLINNFNSNVYLYRSNNPKSHEYFNKIRTMIISYVTDFIDYSNNQNDSQNSKVSEYQRYIEILKSTRLDNPTEEIANITRLMETIAFPQEDCWKVQVYLEKLNLTSIENNKQLADMRSKAEMLKDKYLDKNQELTQLVLEEVRGIDVDAELIPTYSEEIAKKLNCNRTLIQNILVATLANSILYAYIRTDKDSETLETIFKKIVESEIKESAVVIETTEEILSQNQGLISSAIELTDEEIKRFIDLTIDELVQEGATREEAIDYKMLPILKAMAESVDKLKSIDETNEDYKECLETLKDLVQMYLEKVEKNDLELKRIN